MRRLAAFALAGLLAACGGGKAPDRAPGENANHAADATKAGDGVSAEAATVVPAGASAAALPVPEFRGVVPAQGRWNYDASAAAATFSDPGGAARFTLRCDRPARRLVFVRTGEAHPAQGMMRIVTDIGASTFAAMPSGTGAIEASVATFSPFVTQTLAAPVGRIGVQLDDGAVLLMPGDPAIARVARDCRSPG